MFNPIVPCAAGARVFGLYGCPICITLFFPVPGARVSGLYGCPICLTLLYPVLQVPGCLACTGVQYVVRV